MTSIVPFIMIFWITKTSILQCIKGSTKIVNHQTVASFTKEVKPRLAKHPLVFDGRLANRGLTSLVKEATWVPFTNMV